MTSIMQLGFFLMDNLEAPEMLIYIKTQELCLLRTKIHTCKIEKEFFIQILKNFKDLLFVNLF